MKTGNESAPPCQSFNKKKAITCYKLRIRLEGDSAWAEHFEQYRITNETPGEYYVLPIETLQKQSRGHISYHKSGAFHWREANGKRVVPSDGEADYRRPSLVNQVMAHLTGQLDGYCIARGRDVSDEALETMVEIMDGYVIPPLKALRTVEVLKKRKAQTIPMFMSRYRLEAQKFIKEEAERGNIHTITREELVAFVRKEVGEKTNVMVLHPQPDRFSLYSPEAIQHMFSIAAEMITDKLKDKPDGFWSVQKTAIDSPV